MSLRGQEKQGFISVPGLDRGHCPALPVPALPAARGSPLAPASPRGPRVSPSPVPKPFLLPGLCPVPLEPEFWLGLGSAVGMPSSGKEGFAPVADEKHSNF